MTVAQMRRAVHDVYEGKAWRDKVNSMSDIQVQAVYLSFSERGLFDKKKKAEYGKPVPDGLGYSPYTGTQISMFEED